MANSLLARLRALVGISRPLSKGSVRPEAVSNVMMHVTLDTQHATPVRQALIRDCGDQSWTIRLAPLPGTNRMRLSLYLPKAAVRRAIQEVSRVAPACEVVRLMEVPTSPTDAWKDLMQAESSLPPRTESLAPPEEAIEEVCSIAQLLSEQHVLIGVDVADQQALFLLLGRFFEQHHGLSAATVVADFLAREALGSTGLGQGVAVPHGHVKGLPRPMAVYVRPVTPISFNAPDGKAISDVIALLVPDWADNMHLHLLADVAQHFCDSQFREQLHACTEAKAVCRLFAEYGVA